MLKIKSLDYEEEYFDRPSKTKHHWKLQGLEFSNFTLIAGLNASGKTRVCNILTHTVEKIMYHQRQLMVGKTNLTIQTANNKSYRIIINIEEDDNLNRAITREELYEFKKNEEVMLFDRKEILEISKREKAPKKYSPPDDLLTFHARRDKRIYPYLENIITTFKKYHFLDVEGKARISIGGIEKSLPIEIIPSTTSSAYEIMNENQHKKILEDLNSFGFPIEKMEIKPMIIQNIEAPVLFLKEKKVKGIYNIIQASSAMWRLIFLIVYMNLVEKGSCILIDNVGDGLDHKRSIDIVRFLESLTEDIQIILCTNNEILLNQTDIRNWNILHRQGHIVKAYNYANSKDRLEKFAKTGLSSYEYFQDEYFLED